MKTRNNKFLGILMVGIGLWLFLQNAGIISLDGSIVPLIVGIAFLATYLLGQTWALIPGCIVSCVGVVIFVTATGILDPDQYWPLFIFAPSLAFFIIRLVGGEEFKWAIFPGFFIALGGTIATLASNNFFSAKLWYYLNFAGPTALLLVGVFLIFRSHHSKDSRNRDPREPRI